MLFGQDDTLLISDFGIALVVPPTSQLQRTQGIIGTWAYMAPEQFRGKPCFASDQYALGIVVYEWVCGQRPFQGTPFEVQSQHVHASPPSLQQRVSGLPLALEQVVMKALEKDPKDRFESIQAFAAALEEALQPNLSPLATSSGTGKTVDKQVQAQGFIGSLDQLTPSMISTAPLSSPPSPLHRGIVEAPKDFHGNAEKLAKELERAVVPASPEMPQNQPRRISRRVALVAIGLVGATAVGIATGGFVWFSRGKSTPPKSAEKENWAPTGKLPSARMNFPVTVLLTGMVLVEGGQRPGDGYYSEGELFNPKTGIWTSTQGKLSRGRTGHTATLLLDGTVLVAGDYAGDVPDAFLTETELYNPATDQWTTLLKGNMNTGRTAPIAIQLGSGEVLIVGGWNGGSPLNSAEIYNYNTTKNWSRLPNMSIGRVNPRCILLLDGRVLVVGGDGVSSPIADAEIYQHDPDPKRRLWTQARSMIVPRSGFASVRLPTGEVLVAGGNHPGSTPLAELYNPTTNSWSGTKMNMPRKRSGVSLVFALNKYTFP